MSGEASGEIRTLVELELQRLGRREAPRVEGQWLIVGKGAAETRTDIQGTLAQWDSLPEDLRVRRVRQIVELIVQGGTRVPRVPRPRRPTDPPRWYAFVAPVLVVLALSAALLVAFRLLTPNGQSLQGRLSALLHASSSAGSAAAVSADPDGERASLAGSACDRARARISRGATIGPSDVEGWQVELVLLRRGAAADLTTTPALSRFIRRSPGGSVGTLIWPKESSIVAAQRFDAEVALRRLPALGQNQLSGISLVFSGPYTGPYFTEELRSDYTQLADALAEALAATDGALFAHCAGAESHDIGSWFLGPSPGAALGSLIYFMSSTSDTPILKPEVLGNPSDPARLGHIFDAITRAASDLDRSAVATLIGREQGMISGRTNQPSRLTFPFRDANRAGRSNVEAARALGLALPR